MTWFRSPESLLSELGITEPNHIDLEAIAFYLGATVKYRNLDGCAARIVGVDERAIISVDPRCKEGRKRFSLGHEIGHWMNDRGKGAHLCENRMISESESGQNGSETKANKYASDLLLPNSMLKPRLKQRPMTFRTVSDISEEFRTSLVPAAIKVVQNGELPALLVSFNKSGKRRFSKTPIVPDEIWPHDELHQDTHAFEVLYGNKTEIGPLPIGAHFWINHRDSYKYQVIEHSIKTSEDTVYSLLWWKDERQICDLI